MAGYEPIHCKSPGRDSQFGSLPRPHHFRSTRWTAFKYLTAVYLISVSILSPPTHHPQTAMSVHHVVIETSSIKQNNESNSYEIRCMRMVLSKCSSTISYLDCISVPTNITLTLIDVIVLVSTLWLGGRPGAC
ncbi:hypothetical protein RRG08_054648 [Elysia crispata]|uniref:Uncharacterized protein n=1 Tax=Elysia crispata TaxID=231223 RepID=A0AAE1B321_9GAST|nr:hypothetical protein RRG08_054648 [Elysia crispata]